MWQVWMNDRLYGVWKDKWQAELILDMLEITYPSAKLEVRIHGQI